ncbi:MAG: DMT family transporter [Verrucomicrobiota bacterium]
MPSALPRDRLRGLVYLWTAIFIYGAAASVVAKLVGLGHTFAIDGRNPISFCNVLAAGNFVAAVTLFLIYRKDWKPAKLKRLSVKQWGIQFALACISGALAPALMFTAISKTSVTSIVLIETIEIPLGLLLAWLFYRQLSNLPSIIGAGVACIGVLLTLVLQPSSTEKVMGMASQNGTSLSGEMLALIAVVLFVSGSVISKRQLQNIPIGVFSVFRNLVGTVIFAIFVVILFGWEHFIDIFNPVLWFWMLLYGGIVVVCGQLCWFSGIKAVQAQDIAIASACSPVAGIIFAYLILGEIPMSNQIIGGSVILSGIAIGLFGGRLAQGIPQPQPTSTDKAKTFTGV